MPTRTDLSAAAAPRRCRSGTTCAAGRRTARRSPARPASARPCSSTSTRTRTRRRPRSSPTSPPPSATAAATLHRYPDREALALRSDLAAYLTARTGVPLDVVAGLGGQRLQRGAAAGLPGLRRPRPRRAGLRAVVLHAPAARRRDEHRLGRRAPGRRLHARRRHGRRRRPAPPAGDRLPHDAQQPDRHGHRRSRSSTPCARRAPAWCSSTRPTPSSPPGPSAVTLLDRHPRLMVEPHDEQGVRAGRRAAGLPRRRARRSSTSLRLVRLPYHLSALTQAAARVALAHADELLSTVAAVKAQRDRMVRELEALGLQVVPTEANFLLFGPFERPAEVWQALLDRGVLVRDVSGGPGLAGWLRVNAGTEAETTTFLAALRRPSPRGPHDPHGARRAHDQGVRRPRRARPRRHRAGELRHRRAVLRPHGQPSSASTAAST